MISGRQLAILRHAYMAGDTMAAAARAAGCSRPTAARKFHRFHRQGIPRARREPVRLPPQTRRFYDCPVYNGPAIIGKPITRPTPPSGPDWIG